MAGTVDTVIIPAAGLGTRLLPATKSTPKELLPVYDRPAIQFALDEAVAAGARRILLVIGPNKPTLQNYVKTDDKLAEALSLAGKHALREVLQATGVPQGVLIETVLQNEPRGLGDAILCCKPHLEDVPFGVILPDDVIFGVPCLQQMARAYSGGHMVAAQQVAAEEVSRYGIFQVLQDVAALPETGPVHASGMVEKPPVSQAPSRMAAIGRYLLDPVVLSRLAITPPGAGGEVQLTDAISRDARDLPLTAFLFRGQRFDCGCRDGLLAASLARRDHLAASRSVMAAE